MCDFQYPLSYEPILALLLYTDFHVVIFKLKILAIAPPPCSYGHAHIFWMIALSLLPLFFSTSL